MDLLAGKAAPLLEVDLIEIILYIIARSTPEKFGKTKLDQYLILLELQHKIGLLVEEDRYGPTLSGISPILKRMEQSGLLECKHKDGRMFFKVLAEPTPEKIPDAIRVAIDEFVAEWDKKRVKPMQDFVKEKMSRS